MSVGMTTPTSAVTISPSEIKSTTMTTRATGSSAAMTTKATEYIVDSIFEPATTTPTVPAADRCSCSPTEYNFVLDLGQDCDVNQLEGSPGVGLTFCLLGSHDSRFPNTRRLGGGDARRRLKHEKQERVSLDPIDGYTPVTKRQLADDDIEIISVQFLEFDTSGRLIVINQDDTYSNATLADGDTITFKSISRDLDPEKSIEDQLELLPGGVQVTLRGRATDEETGEEKILSNRITWSYTNGCDVEPLSEGMGIGWTTFGELAPPSKDFCPASSASPAPSPSVAVDPTPVPTKAETDAPTDAPVTPPPTDAPSCSFCPDGIDNPDLVLPTDDGATCQTAADFAKALGPDDVMCGTVQMAQALCCPPEPPTSAPKVETKAPTDEPKPETKAPTEAPKPETPSPVAVTEPEPTPDTTTTSATDPATPPETPAPTPNPTPRPTEETPIFASKSAKMSKACDDGSDDAASAKSSKCKSSKAKTKKTPTKTKTHKNPVNKDPMAKVAKESDMAASGKSSKGSPIDSKSGKALVDVDAKAEKASNVETKSAKAAADGKADKSKEGAKSVKASKADVVPGAKAAKGSKAKRLFHGNKVHSTMSLP